MKLDRILLTTDLSEESLRAFAPLAELVRDRGSQVILLHVVEEVALVPRGAPFAASIILPGAEKDQQKAQQWLTEHGAPALNGLPVEVRVIKAEKTGEAICEYAREHQVDLIAMATHGHSGFKRVFLGSTADTVLRHADRPVLVFPRPH